MDDKTQEHFAEQVALLKAAIETHLNAHLVFEQACNNILEGVFDPRIPPIGRLTNYAQDDLGLALRRFIEFIIKSPNHRISWLPEYKYEPLYSDQLKEYERSTADL